MGLKGALPLLQACKFYHRLYMFMTPGHHRINKRATLTPTGEN